MNPQVGELWKYKEEIGGGVNYCIIVDMKRIGGVIFYTLHWLGERNLNECPSVEFFQKYRRYFRKLS